jgi:hypothetical protein
MSPITDVVGYQRFAALRCLLLRPEDGGSMVLRNCITTLCQNPEDRDLNLHRRENFKSQSIVIMLSVKGNANNNGSLSVHKTILKKVLF